MNIEKKLNSLKEYVESKAAAEADEIMKKAKAQVKAIEEEYQKKGEETYAQIVDDAKRKAKVFEEREISQSNSKSSKMILDAKNEIVNKAIEELKEAMYALNESKDYEVLLKKFTLEAVKELGKEEVVVFVRKEDVKKMREIAKNIEKESKVKINVSPDNVEIVGGVIVATKDNHVIVENTLENKFEEIKEKFISALFSILNVDG